MLFTIMKKKKKKASRILLTITRPHLGVVFFFVLHNQESDQLHEDFFSSTFYLSNISSIFSSLSFMHCPIPPLHVPQFQHTLNHFSSFFF